MKNKSKIYASWNFLMRKFTPSYLKDRLQERHPFNLVYNIYVVLKLLEEEKLLTVKTLEFFMGEAGSFKLSVEHLTNEQKVIEILKEMSNRNVGMVIYFYGWTELLVNGSYEKEEDILEFSFTHNLEELIIISHSDCWVPIDEKENLQIELAKDCSNRLERFLKNLDKMLFFEEKSPIINEDHEEELLPQKGNRVYIPEYILRWMDLSKEQLEEIKEFIWENRNENK